MMSKAVSGDSKNSAGVLSQSFPGHFNAFPQVAAIITAMIGLTGLAGWAFSFPLLKSVFPGVVEMKANTASCLVIAAFALFLLGNRPSRSQERWARILALAVVVLGLSTLSQYLLGWQLGIDELLFRDTADAYNAVPGRMSPYTAFTFSITGLALTALTWRTLRPLVLLISIVVTAIGAIAVVGYLWNADSLVTDIWLPPVAFNTACAFILLGAGTFRTGWVLEQMQTTGRSVEIKILAGFIGAFLLLLMIGGYTYRKSAEYADSAKWVNHTQQVRAELGQLYGTILDVESMQRSYLLTGKQSYKVEYAHFVAEMMAHTRNLARLVADNPAQAKNVAELEPLIAHRTSILSRHIEIFERQGDAAARVAISTDDGIQTMQVIRTLVKSMDNLELMLLSNRDMAFAHNRDLTLFMFLATLAVSIGIFAALFLGIRREIMARAQTEALLSLAKEKAEKASQAKDSFLATMSHEIRTPLTGMLGMLELISLTRLDGEQRPTLDMAWESGRSLLRIVNDILDWSKIEEGKLELAPRATSIASLLQGVVNTYSRIASAKSLTLRHHSDPRLGPAHIVDPLRLSQVLNNFVSNAIKFTQHGEIELCAALLEQLDSGERICFSVKDTGLGIARDVQERLFQRYRQESADTARMYGGTGLGLAICRRLAEMMDGLIELKSEQGLGSIFSITLTLPVTGAPDEAVPGLYPEVEQRAVKPLFAAAADAPRVLAVDDHPINRKLLAQQIKLLGLRVETAENGQEALSMWRSGRIALIITDCHMPVMDGYALSRAIRKIEAGEARPRTPIIAWTANALAEEAVQCHAADMDELLVKPATLMQVKKLLAKWMSIAEDGSQPPPAPLDSDNGHSGTIDYTVLNMIMTDSAAQVQVLLDFQTHIDADLVKLGAMLAQGDRVNVERTAHRMKGASRMVGATYLAKACAAIEQAARDGDMAGAGAAKTALDEAIGKFETYLVETGKPGRVR